ncbi:MAG: glycosyltransferase [Geobacteraceae bacterium]|nr:glycosyltransferase [Geobacteraceae bacterium]NTW79440.1 glycosyltransferase [Geobacteraceae bacterium]
MRISVITVTLNSERFLAECLASVASQGDGLHEHIIVDGGSTDATVEIIRKHAASDARVHWISEPDNGISDAMNKGAAMATGDVIAHLNSDDYYADPRVLATVLDCFYRNPEYSWLTAGFSFVSGRGTFIRDIRVRKFSFRRLVRGNIILHPSTFIKRDLFNSVGGFDVSLSYCMDYDLFLRVAMVSPPLVVDKQLSCFRAHAGSRSVSQSEQAYAEEFHVRMAYLRSVKRSTLYYRFDYGIKRYLNKLLYRRLLAESGL